MLCTLQYLRDCFHFAAATTYFVGACQIFVEYIFNLFHLIDTYCYVVKRFIVLECYLMSTGSSLGKTLIGNKIKNAEK